MFLLLVMATSGSVMLVLERQQGLLRRLASAPIHRTSVVMGKVTGKLALGMLQIAFAMLAGTLFFKMSWGPDLPTVVTATDVEVLFFIEQHHLMGRGMGYIDAHLLASTFLGNAAKFWTRDKRLAALAVELGKACQW